jgi:hypothetical protein
MAGFRLFVFFISLPLIGCKTPHFLNKRQLEMEKFNIVDYNRLQINGIARYIRSDGSQITLKDAGAYYTEEIRKESNSPFATTYRFFKSSLKLKGSGSLFYKIATGVFKEYNEKGELVSEKDFDAQYKFTIDSLIDKMKKEFNINLLTPTAGLMVYRYVDAVTKSPEYVIQVPIRDLVFRHIVLDGNSGRTKKDFIATNVEY